MFKFIYKEPLVGTNDNMAAGNKNNTTIFETNALLYLLKTLDSEFSATYAQKLLILPIINNGCVFFFHGK